ncbi:DUF308 domain-containing protein [Demequina sediminicola]|uniref:DUF308 domain-containing protein n=1 Tax=Demequina sediminicola TaxID=1095026 RepID=UPI0007825363|nr:DUF308 domain-containing protein [Demequina sediminicola]
MSVPPFPNEFAIDPEQLTRRAVSAARITMGVVGAIAIGIGIALLVWPGESLEVLAVFAAIFFLISGAVRAAVGVFSRDVSSGYRLLNIIVGILLLLGGVVMLKNLSAATGVLTVVVVILIGMGWIIEGIATLAQAGKAQAGTMAYVRGAIAIIAGIVVIVVPGWSAFALIIMTGVTLILLGIVGLVQAFALGRNLPPAGDAEGEKDKHQVIDG